MITNKDRVLTNFGVYDSKWREMGATAYVQEFDEDSKHYFYCSVQTTKDGVPFGICQPEKLFSNAQDRTEYIKKRVIELRDTITLC